MGWVGVCRWRARVRLYVCSDLEPTPSTADIHTYRDNPQGFSVSLASEKHGLRPDELAQALKVLEVPRVVERHGQKFGYWN